MTQAKIYDEGLDLEVVLAPDIRLKQVSPRFNIKNLTQDKEALWSLGKLSEAMHELCKRSGGVGLAAPQVGIPLRMFAIQIPDDPSRFGKYAGCHETFLNPMIRGKKGKKFPLVTSTEGCLSIPGVEYEVQRWSGLNFSAWTLSPSGIGISNKPVKISTNMNTAYLAIILQHEFDHLDGVLISDEGKGTLVPKTV